MSKTTNKFSREVRQRAVRLVLDHENEHSSRWAAITSIAAEIGCTGQTLNEWVKKAEVDAGKRGGVPTDMATKLKALNAGASAGQLMESFMKTLKAEGVYLLAFENPEEVADQLPRFIEKYNARRLHSALGYLSPIQYEEQNTRSSVKTAA